MHWHSKKVLFFHATGNTTGAWWPSHLRFIWIKISVMGGRPAFSRITLFAISGFYRLHWSECNIKRFTFKMVVSTWAWYCRYNIQISFLESVLEDWVLNDTFPGIFLVEKKQTTKRNKYKWRGSRRKAQSDLWPNVRFSLKTTVHFLVKHGENSIYWLLLLREM